MEITVTAPNRIDLAGGTTDIYPLYLFMGGGCTVNVAITVFSRLTLRPLEGSRIRIVSEDLRESVEAARPEDIPIDGPLGLLGRAVRAFPPASGIEMRTHNHAPAGSGLGASSALLTAAIVALLKHRGEEHTQEKIVDVTANIETSAIAVPTGKQDHIAAVYGGVSLIEFGLNNFARTGLDEDSAISRRLEDMLVLTYTGGGRFSGMNNWEITKGYIDGSETIREKLLQIRNVARDVGRVLTNGSWKDLPDLINREWTVRRTLAPGVSTPRIDAMINAANRAGALASKICGAGGGGCMITLVPPGQRTDVEAALVDAGGELMPFAIESRGVTVNQKET
jgi:D-glycero-alpha-D-manno-heptose-7-phosphate kinase